MSTISASDVNTLRKKTGAGMMDCKNALVEAKGDFDTAIDVLRKKGQKIASKRADRDATEGVVLGLVSEDSKFGAIISINCETDFVAKNEDFISLTKQILHSAIQGNIETSEDLKKMEINGITVQEKLLEQTGVIGEKIELGFYETIQANLVSAYTHHGNKLASIVGLNIYHSDYIELGKDLCMQIAAMNPLGINESDISKEVLDKELEIAKDLARKEGKPEQMIEKIALGRLGKFFKENTLIKQSFIKDNKKSIEAYLKENNPDLIVTQYKRFGLSN
jgi:elongation factor Ts